MATGPRLLWLTLGLCACTQAPVSESLDVPWEHEARPRYQVIPDQTAIESTPPPTVDEPEPEVEIPEVVPKEPHVGPPRIVVSSLADGSDDDQYDGAASCPFTIEAGGFPAISEDGRTVVTYTDEVLSSSSGEDGIVTVAWIDVASDTTETTRVVLDGDWFSESAESEDEGELRCRRLWRRARARAAEVNATLAAGSWRTMTRLPVDARTPFGFEPDDDPHQDHDPHHEGEPLRRAELFLRKGQAILRVPGVRVLERHSAADWDHGLESPGDDDDEACDFSAYPVALFADRDTGVAVVQVGQEAGPCFCYSHTTYRVIGVSPASYDAILERDAARLRSGVAERSE